MGLKDRDYMKGDHSGTDEIPAWRYTDLRQSSASPPQQTITYVVSTTKKDDGSSAAGCGCLLVLLVVVVGILVATGHGANVLKALGGSNPGYGVNVCTTAKYSIDNVECTAADSTISDLSDARLAVTHQSAFVANTFSVTVSEQQADGTTNQVCTSSLDGAQGNTNAGYHLDQVLQQCGAHLQSGQTYLVEVDQDTESLGTATFTYVNSSTVSYQQRASAPAWSMQLCPANKLDMQSLMCRRPETILPKSAVRSARIVVSSATGTIHGLFQETLFRQGARGLWHKQAEVYGIIKQRFGTIDPSLFAIFHNGHAPPILLGVPYKVSVYDNHHKLGSVKFHFVAG